ncbi:MAG: hypothetical protein EBU59_01590 [Planctomycetia bacterium]|nr:hypothetical protein [Planctomycetia bacterium]
MTGKNRVGDFMWQNRVEHPFFTALDVHGPVEDLTAVKHKTGCTTGAQCGGHLGRDGAGTAPAGKRLADPLDGQVVPILFCRVTDALGQVVSGGLNDEVGRSIACRRGGSERDKGTENC